MRGGCFVRPGGRPQVAWLSNVAAVPLWPAVNSKHVAGSAGWTGPADGCEIPSQGDSSLRGSSGVQSLWVHVYLLCVENGELRTRDWLPGGAMT